MQRLLAVLLPGLRETTDLHMRNLPSDETLTARPDRGKPLIDPYCLCGKLHPCPEHSRERDGQLALFAAELEQTTSR